MLEDVKVLMDAAEAEEFEEEATISLPTMPHTGVGHTFVLLRKPAGLVVGKFATILSFKAKEIDPATGEAEEEGYADEYQLEDVEVLASDYIKPAGVGNFKKVWDELDEEYGDDYSLGEREGIQETVEMVTGLLGMAICDGTDAVPPNARSHTVLLSGIVIGEKQVLVRISFGIDAASNVAMKVVAKSNDAELCELMHQIITES